MNKLDNIIIVIRRIVEILLVELDYIIRVACKMIVRSYFKSVYLMFFFFFKVLEENL